DVVDPIRHARASSSGGVDKSRLRGQYNRPEDPHGPDVRLRSPHRPRRTPRRPTASNKGGKFDKDVLPLWVADMDFASPEPVVRALRERAEHGVYGYVFEEPEFFEVVADRIQKRYGWRVGPEAVVLLPGVIAGLNMAARVFAAPGNGLLEQVPVYPPILRCPSNIGLTRDEAPLARRADGRYEVDWEAFERAIHGRTPAFIP